MRTGLSCTLIGIFFLLNHANAAELTPTSDCTEAHTTAGRLICGDADLAAADMELSNLYVQVDEFYGPERRKSFEAGQKIWLKLREDACLLGESSIADEAKRECLSSLYKRRMAELSQQMDLAKGGNGDDIDAVLDGKIKLTWYSPEEISAMTVIINGIRRNERRIPETCREFFTLSGGFWTYYVDTTGMNSEYYALTTCQFVVFSAQSRLGKAVMGWGDDQFENIELYSNEFGCFGLCKNENGDLVHNYNGMDVVSFQKMKKDGIIKIEHGAIPVQHDEYDRPETLIIDGHNFFFDGDNFKILSISRGDFTGNGRKEALIQIYIHSVGTMSNHRLLLAYYDPQKDAIRPAEISKDSIFRILSVRNYSE